MSEHYILKKVQCEPCKGTGLEVFGAFDPAGNDRAYEESDCEDCEGKGIKYEPIEFTEDLKLSLLSRVIRRLTR